VLMTMMILVNQPINRNDALMIESSNRSNHELLLCVCLCFAW